MCILFLAINQDSDYPLIICANRDEFHQRPTQAAHFWPDNSNLLAGKDLEAGGSWLGVNKAGYFAAITNLRTGQPPSENKKSRGDLVMLALQSDSLINKQWLEQYSHQYNPFNLIYGSLHKLFCFNSASGQQTTLSDGFHAISNASMDDVWPKMTKGERGLESLVKSNQKIDKDKLLLLLQDQTKVELGHLPNTGIPVEWEQLLSSIFICSEKYGTRSSSLVLQKEDSSIEFLEVQYDVQGKQVNLSSFTFPLNTNYTNAD